MRRGRFVDRGNAHEAGDLQPVVLPARAQESVGIFRQDARFLRLGSGIDLDEQQWTPVLPLDLPGKRGAKTRPIDGMYGIEYGDGFFRLVRLQRADQMQLDVG